MLLPYFVHGKMTFWAGFYTRQAYIQDRLIFKTCLYSRQAYIQDRLIFKTGLYSRQAYIQDRLMCSSCAIISSIHSAKHAYRNSTFVCSIHDYPYNKLNKNSLLQAAATIRERHICRHAVAKCRFYSRATSIRERLLFKGGLYTRLYGICFLLAFVRLPHLSLFS